MCLESLLKIKEKMIPEFPVIWRYATNIGEMEDQEVMDSGWILEK